MKINTVLQPDRRMPTRRKLLIVLGAGVLAAPLASFAQQAGQSLARRL